MYYFINFTHQAVVVSNKILYYELKMEYSELIPKITYQLKYEGMYYKVIIKQK